MDTGTERIYEFGPFRLDCGERVLLREGSPVPLTPKALEVLLLLVERHGHIVEKDEFINRVWADSFVEEGNLKVTVSMLRKVLGEGAGGSQYIETVARRGYRFVAAVTEARDGEAPKGVPKDAGPEFASAEKGEGEAGSVERRAAATVPTSAAADGARMRGLLWPALIICLVVAAALAAYAIRAGRRAREGTAAAGENRSMAVLPFKSLVAGGGDEYLGVGIADTLITRLSSVREINVRPTSAVRKYGGAEADPLAAGRELQVDSVLEGDIQHLGDRVRVTARLVKVGDGSTLWAGQFDEKFTDIFAVEDAISQRVAGALALRLSGDERARLTKRDTQSSEAYQLYLEGRYFWGKRTREGNEQAVKYFERAIQLDPTYALAYAGLSDSYSVQLLPLPPAERLEKAKEAAEKAIALDDSLAEAHTSLASALEDHDWDFARAEAEYQKAIRLNPNYATARQWYAEYLMHMGRFGEAEAEMRRAQELDPRSLIIHSDIGLIHYEMRQYDQAIEQLRKTLEMDSQFEQALRTIVRAYEEKGMFDEAIATSGRMVEDDAEGRRFTASLKESYAAQGARGYWRVWVRRAESQSARGELSAADMAEVYAAAGERERSFEFLEKAFAYHSKRLLWLKVDPQYDSLRADARFARLLARVGFPED